MVRAAPAVRADGAKEREIMEIRSSDMVGAGLLAVVLVVLVVLLVVASLPH
jgi:hypothetical protein